MENDMTDVLFDLEGGFLPRGYGFPLWKAISALLPWLEDQRQAGILPLKGSPSGEHLLLPKRAKLALRIPGQFAQTAMALCGKTLDVDGTPLKIGSGRQKAIEPYPTLHAQIVESTKNETDFIDDVSKNLAEMQISCKLICGKHQTLKHGKDVVSGYSLVVHDLKPAESIRLQYWGLGDHRHFGCGLFVPHKTIAGLE